jgi:hypothetical protein
MHRLTARFLLLFLVVGATEPMLQALSAVPPHACCLRKLHGATGRQSGIHDSTRHQGNCCPPMTAPFVASFRGSISVIVLLHSSELVLTPAYLGHTFDVAADHPSRAPPALS